MADQNQSGRRGMNSFADDIDQSSFLTELERIGARASRKGIQRSDLESRIRREGKELNSLLEEGRRTPEFTSSPFYQEQTSALRENIRNIRTKMNSLDTAARGRAESEASTYISRQFSQSTINGQVSSIQKESAIQNRAFSMAGQSYDALEAQRADVYSNIRVRERQALNEVKGMYSGRGQVDPERSAALGVMMNGTQDQVRQIAMINAAQAFQRASGNDPLSKMKNLADMGNVATSILSTEAMKDEVRSGGVNISSGRVANSDIDKEIINQAKALSEALKELANGVTKTDEELSKLRTTADESASNLDKLQKAQQAGGGGYNAGSVLNAAAGGFNAAGAAMQQILVGQRMGEMGNITGFANLANQQYDMYKKARGGDIASQLAMSQWDDADQFGMEMKRGTNMAQSAYLAAGAAQTAAGAVKMAEGGAQKFNPASYITGSSTNNTEAVISGGSQVVQGLATTAVTGADMARGVSANAARLAGIQANMQARMAVNAIPAEQMQGLRNYYTDLDVAAQGAGFGSNQFLDNASSVSTLNRMSEMRMSPEQMAKFSAVGFQSMGSTFNTEQIFAARNLEKKGFGSMGDNMQRMATLAGAGANNPQEGMEQVLSAAVARGLDTSKSINMMVDHTASLMQTMGQSTAAGINNTASIASQLAANVNPNTANKEFALQRAAQITDVTNQVTTDTSVSFTGMVNTARISKDTGLSGTNALFAAKLTSADIRSLQGMDPKAAEEALLKKGIDPTQARGGVQGMLQQLLVGQTNQMFTGSGSLAFGSNAERQGLSEAALAGTNYDNLTKQQKALLGKIGTTSGLTGEEYYQGAAGIKNIQNVSSDVGKELTKDADVAGKKGDFDTLRTGGFKQLADAAATAATNLEKFGGAVKVFVELQKEIEKGGMAKENEFSGAGAKFSKDLTASLSAFSTATTKYEQASQAIIDAVGVRSNAIPVVPNAATDMLDSVKGSGRGGRN